jgi:hypothetical protein
MNLMSWRPKKRNVTYSAKPDYIPEWVYTEAVAAKRHYNEGWEFWVYQVSIEYNCSQAVSEVACIRGVQQAINRLYLIYGPKIGKWYEEYLDLGDLLKKVIHPTYIAELEPLKEKN